MTRMVSAGGAALAAALLLACLASGSASAQSFGIAATVNDELISAWDVDQRVKFYQATGGTGGEGLRKKALEELVEELLMDQEAKRVGVTVDANAVRESITNRLKSLNRTYDQFKQYLEGRGVEIATLENQVRSKLAWASVIRRTYGNLISITDADVDEAAEEATASDTAEGTAPAADILVLQRIVLKVPPDVSDSEIARRMEDAERIREVFIDCTRNANTVKRFADVTLEDLPSASADTLEEPTRSLVLAATAGQITPPNVTPSGVEMIAVCERKADGGKRDVVERQLLNQELTLLSSRHLRDIRQDAVVEYR